MSTRVAFVTGASRGIGRAIALSLAEAGHSIVVASPEMELNEQVAAVVRKMQPALVVDLDLTRQESIVAGFEAAMAEFGRLDVLVNNAGITKDALALRMKKDAWDLVIQVNLTGAFLASQQAIPAMMKQRWGRIINIASVVGQSGNPGQANYVASKAGIIGLTKCLAQELGGRNITVNAVAPGFIETDMTRNLPAEVREKMLASVPLKRPGTPEDVA